MSKLEKKLERALARIAKPRYPQGVCLYDCNQRARAEYWRDTALEYRRIASRALKAAAKVKP